MDEFLTVDEVAEHLRTSPETVRYWRHVGKGPESFKVGRRVLYAVADVEAFLAERRGQTTTPTRSGQPERPAVTFSVACPNCGDRIAGEVELSVTNYQPSGPPGTPRCTTVAPAQAKGESRILVTHECT